MLKGKKGLIMGVATDHSIAWGISKLADQWGAELVFSYPHDIFKGKIEKLIKTLNTQGPLFHCDVAKEGHIPELMKNVSDHFGKIDFVVHAIAYCDKKELQGYYYNTSRSNFLNGMNVSCYSFTEVCREVLPFMNPDGGSLLTLTHHGSQKVFPNYNCMGVMKAALEASVRYLASDLGEKNIRVNAVSAGAIKTLAASAIGDFSKFLKIGEEFSPMGRNITLEDVAGLAAFLLSDYAKGITGDTHYVDCGLHIMQCPKDNKEEI